MGINTAKVRLLAVAVVYLLPLCSASLCVPSLQYWSEETESCVNCSRCDLDAKHVVIRPCQGHTDTVCGPISDLDIDWTWLKNKGLNKHHDKHHLHSESNKKKHHKKSHNHHLDIDDDLKTKSFHHGLLDDEVETITLKQHNGHKNHQIVHDEVQKLGKKPKKHDFAIENLISDDLNLFYHKKLRKMPPPPPLKSTDDLEKEWKEWLIQSKNRLQHRKEDLLKNLHKESPYNEKHSNHKLNQPSGNVFDDFDGEIFHHSSHHKDHSARKHFSPLDIELFDKLLNHEHQKHGRLGVSHHHSQDSRHGDLLNMLKSDHKKKTDDINYPVDPLDFQSVVPTHRLILGEPSTVSEMLDQELDEEAEDERVQDSDPGVVAVPFTAAERLVWDWQAVALTSAVAACMLFFAVVAVYSILHAHQWKRHKISFDRDTEELSVKMGLISSPVGASAADAVSTNVYLDNLLENKKKCSNFYTQKRPVS